MKSVKYFVYMAFAVTALLAACGKSNNGSVTAGVPNNCAVNQGYNSTVGCLQITGSNQCGYQSAGQLQGISSSGQCATVECVNNGNGCVATGSSGYYNNGSYVNSGYGYGSAYGYGSGYNSGNVIYGNGYPVYGSSLPPVYGSGFYPQQPSYGYGYGYPYNGYGGYGGGSSISGGIYFHSGY